MIAGIRQGHLPDPAALRGRCQAAMTKKLALVSLPPTFWESDPKRNPDTCHLLWAVLLLQDPELLEIIKGIIPMEQAEREGLEYQAFLDRAAGKLLALAPNPEVRSQLEQAVAWARESDAT